MWSTFGDVLPAAITIALSPIPIALVIPILNSERARTNGPAFALAWFLAVTIAVAVFSLVGKAAGADSDADVSDAVDWLQVGLGALFIYLAVRSWRKRPRPGVTAPEPKLFSAVDTMSIWMAFGVGALFAVVNPKNLPLELSAGATVAQSGLQGAEAVTVIVLFALLASASLMVIVAASLILGERVRGALDAARDWLLENNATIMTVLFSVLGAKMLGDGLAILD